MSKYVQCGSWPRWTASVSAVIGTLSLFATPSLIAQASDNESPLKVGVINLDAVAFQSPAGQALQRELAQFQEAFTIELQTRQEAARTIEAQVAESDSLPEEARRALERDYQDVITDFQRFQQDKQQEGAALRADGITRIREELNPAIESIQAELQYDLVLNSQTTWIVIFSDRIDITQSVIDRLPSTEGNPQ